MPRARSIAVVFAANGLGGPSFLARLPERQADLGLSDSELGLALVGLALGALMASPAAGRLVGAIGSRRVVVASTVALGACMWLVGAAPNAVVLFVALAVVGAADAGMDIAMNANGAAYEDRSARSVMHRLHAAWSIGALGAAGMAGLAATLGVPLTVHLAGAGLVLVVATLLSRPGLMPDTPPPPRPTPAQTAHAADGDPGVTDETDGAAGAPGTADTSLRAGGDPGDTSLSGAAGGTADGERRATLGEGAAPGGTVGTGRSAGRRRGRRVAWPLAVLALATIGGAMVEGGPTDWSAIQLERFGTGEGVAALGVATFMAGLLAGRLVGDWLTDRLGGPRLLRLGSSLVAGGIALGAVTAHPVPFMAGLVLAGLGAAGFFPLAFSAASRTPGVSPGAAAATVSLAARIGFLTEPVLLGAVSEAVGLRWAFGLVAATAVAMAAAAHRIIPAAAPLGEVAGASTCDVRTP